jgi:hypothetical protein
MLKGESLEGEIRINDPQQIGKLQKRTTFANDVQLKLRPGTDPKNLRLAAFVQSSGPGKLLGAALWKALPGKTRSDIRS